MKHKLALSSLLLAGILTLAQTALAATTWYVNGVNGSDSNNCMSLLTACRTIGHAVALASSGDTIIVAAATYYENLHIGINLNVIGAGATTTIVDGGRANPADAVFTIPIATAIVSLSMLTMRHGSISAINNKGTLTINASAITNSYSGSCGGGVLNNGGVLTISDSIISGNITSDGICNVIGTTTINKSTISGNGAQVGGGIENYGGILRINNSTISQNAANLYCFNYFRKCFSAYGGGIYNSDNGTVTITNSTITENSASGGDGGGISNRSGTVRINNSTISNNGASEVCAFGHCYGGSGGGIYGSATLQNSIIANSAKGGNCNGAVTSNGYNMSSDGTCNFHNSGDRNSTNPMLGTLGNYGGPTQTIPLLSGSPAIDSGNPSGCTDGSGLLTTDQRGYPRHDSEDTGGCDMGAYERQSD